jgi:hypothetical protein
MRRSTLAQIDIAIEVFLPLVPESWIREYNRHLRQRYPTWVEPAARLPDDEIPSTPHSLSKFSPGRRGRRPSV